MYVLLKAGALNAAVYITCAGDCEALTGAPVGADRRRTRGRAGDGMLIGVTKGYCSFLDESQCGERAREFEGLGTDKERERGSEIEKRESERN